MSNDKGWKKLIKPKRYSLVFAAIVAFLSVLSAGVSTFAWFQAEARVRIETATPQSATISVSAPEGAKFYYFNGNGNPGSSEYVGYSQSGAAFGNTTNLVDVSTHKYKTSAITYSLMDTFANTWTQIDLSSVSTSSGDASPKNCFDFSRMRPGCYYSFCIETNLSTSKLNLAFRWDSTYGKTGNDVLPKRYIASTVYPLNLLMAVNSYCTNLSTTDATTFIEESLGVGTTLSLSDKIDFANVGTGTTTSNYYLLGSAGAGATTSSAKYIYFTISMGDPNRADALLYTSKEGTGSSEILYYTRNQSTGNYSSMDGLKSTLSTISVS